MITITKVDIETLLCRPLTSCEESNLALYIENIKTQLTVALCFDPFETSGVFTKTFEYVDNQSYYLLQPHTDVSSIAVADCDGSIEQDIICDWQSIDKDANFVDSSKCAFGLKRCGCNTCADLTCCKNKCKKLVVTANWNSCPMDDLKLVALKMLEQDIKNSTCNDNVKSKQIRSMTITYKDAERIDYLVRYKSIIDKWRVCNVDIA